MIADVITFVSGTDIDQPRNLAQSTDLYDLENRQREIERKGANNRFYI